MHVPGPVVDPFFLASPWKPVIVGQAPARLSDPSDPLGESASTRRLADLCGMSVDEFRDFFSRANLLGVWPGYAGSGPGGDDFPEIPAAVAAGRLTKVCADRVVILLGKKVGQAFGRDRDARFLTWSSNQLLFPHPSGVSRWWNEEGNRIRAEVVMRRLIEQVRRGT